MQLEHLAIWTQRLEALRAFYVRYFGGVSNEKYVNPTKGFESYFLSFGEGCRIELMRRTDVVTPAPEELRLGLCHLAFRCASREEVVALTERLRADGYPVLGEPRTTGDGCFESVVGDPDGNRVEIVF